MDSNTIYSFANSHIDVLKDIPPFTLILIFSTIFASFFLFLGKEYNFVSFFFIIQSLTILLIYQINSNKINSMFNAIVYTTLIILYFFVIFFGIALYNNSSSINIFIKFTSLLYILLFSQPTNNANIFSIQMITTVLLFLYSSMLIYDYFTTRSLNREE